MYTLEQAISRAISHFHGAYIVRCNRGYLVTGRSRPSKATLGGRRVYWVALDGVVSAV